MKEVENYKIGDKIPFGRVTLEVVESDCCDDCIFCDWEIECENLLFALGSCCSGEREDNKVVVFKLCEEE